MVFQMNLNDNSSLKESKLLQEVYLNSFQHICKLSGWKTGSKNFVQAHELFIDIWRNLQDYADENIDGAISEDEWVKRHSCNPLCC